MKTYINEIQLWHVELNLYLWNWLNRNVPDGLWSLPQSLNSYRNANHSFQTWIFSVLCRPIERIQLIKVHVSDEIIGKDIWRVINTNSAIKCIAYGTWSSSLINGRSQFLYVLCPYVRKCNNRRKTGYSSPCLQYPYTGISQVSQRKTIRAPPQFPKETVAIFCLPCWMENLYNLGVNKQQRCNTSASHSARLSSADRLFSFPIFSQPL
jgi:hypothetical protein